MGVCAVCVLGVQGVLGSCVSGRGCGIVCCMRMSMRRRKEFADGIVRVCIVAAACAIIIKFVYMYLLVFSRAAFELQLQARHKVWGRRTRQRGTIYQPAVWQVHLPKS